MTNKTHKWLALTAVLVGVLVALIANSSLTVAKQEKKDSTKKTKVLVRKSGCRPSKCTCYVEKRGDSLIVRKGMYEEIYTTVYK